METLLFQYTRYSGLLTLFYITHTSVIVGDETKIAEVRINPYGELYHYGICQIFIYACITVHVVYLL